MGSIVIAFQRHNMILLRCRVCHLSRLAYFLHAGLANLDEQCVNPRQTMIRISQYMCSRILFYLGIFSLSVHVDR